MLIKDENKFYSCINRELLCKGWIKHLSHRFDTITHMGGENNWKSHLLGCSLSCNKWASWTYFSTAEAGDTFMKRWHFFVMSLKPSSHHNWFFSRSLGIWRNVCFFVFFYRFKGFSCFQIQYICFCFFFAYIDIHLSTSEKKWFVDFDITGQAPCLSWQHYRTGVLSISVFTI